MNLIPIKQNATIANYADLVTKANILKIKLDSAVVSKYVK